MGKKAWIYKRARRGVWEGGEGGKWKIKEWDMLGACLFLNVVQRENPLILHLKLQDNLFPTKTTWHQPDCLWSQRVEDRENLEGT